MKKNGFISISIIYSFFIVILLLLVLIMSTYINNRLTYGIYLNDIKKELFLDYNYTGCKWSDDYKKCVCSVDSKEINVTWLYCLKEEEFYYQTLYDNCDSYYIIGCQNSVEYGLDNAGCLYYMHNEAKAIGVLDFKILDGPFKGDGCS